MGKGTVSEGEFGEGILYILVGLGIFVFLPVFLCPHSAPLVQQILEETLLGELPAFSAFFKCFRRILH